MAFSTLQAQTIVDSYALICRETVNYSELFYHRLLHRNPFARTIFPDDMSQQVEIFKKTIDVLVDQVSNFPALRPTLVAIGRRHVGYGVRAQHYAIVGEVLIDSFEELLGDRFTPTVREAWQTLYGMAAAVMVNEAYTDDAAQS